MDDKSASKDAFQKKEKLPLNSTTQEDTPQLLKWWDQLWGKIQNLGMADIAMRVGSALVTIGLVGLIIWLMKDFFISGEMASTDVEAFELAAGGEISGGVELPSYSGVGEVEGLSRSVEAHKEGEVTSRYEFSKYEVVANDSIYGIAEKYSLKPETVLYCNEVLLGNPAFIKPGQILEIPPTDGVLHTWHEGEGLNGVANGLGVTPEDIIEWPGNDLNPATIGDYANPNIEVGTKLFAPGGYKVFADWTKELFTRDEAAISSSLWGEGQCAPVSGGLTGTGTYEWPSSEHFISGYEYSPEINHWGIDIGGKTGNPIYATDSGVVVYAGWSSLGYGNVIAIDHGQNADGVTVQSVYAHLSEIYVSCGTSVYQGAVIGAMGSTGNSSGPHLHFELIIGSFKANPHSYLGE